MWMCVLRTESWKPKSSWIWLMEVESKSRSSLSLEMVAAMTRLSGEWMKSRRMHMIRFMCSTDSCPTQICKYIHMTHLLTQKKYFSVYGSDCCNWIGLHLFRITVWSCVFMLLYTALSNFNQNQKQFYCRLTHTKNLSWCTWCIHKHS